MNDFSCYFLFEEKVTKENISKSKRTNQSLDAHPDNPIRKNEMGLKRFRLILPATHCHRFRKAYA